MTPRGWDFAAELRAWGPAAGARPPSRSAAAAYCASVTRRHYENFSVASLLMPRRLLPHVRAVYAYCRWADDLADETAGGDESLALLGWWRHELLACYAGDVRHPVMVALRDTVTRFRIPPTPLLNLLSAFEQDQHIKRYDTFDQLLGYCRNSADPVGHLVLHLFEVYNDTRAALSDDICTGLQLANLWQDVARDSALGRVYLPRQELDRFGVPEGDIAARRFTPGYADMLRSLVARTRGLFDRGEPLLATLPPVARANVGLFLGGGRAVLTAVGRAGYDTLTRRPVVSNGRKLGLVGKALLGRLATG